MAYQIEISPTVIADIEAVFLWIKADSPERAYRWVRGCYEVMLTLERGLNGYHHQGEDIFNAIGNIGDRPKLDSLARQ